MPPVKVWRYDARDMYERRFLLINMGVISFFIFFLLPSVPVRRALLSNESTRNFDIKGAAELRHYVAAHGGIEQNDGAWSHHQGGGNVRSEHVGDGRRVSIRALDHGQPSDHGTDEHL